MTSDDPKSQVSAEFEREAEALRRRLDAGALAGTDGERSREQAERLVERTRAEIAGAATPSEARERLAAFRDEAARL